MSTANVPKPQNKKPFVAKQNHRPAKITQDNEKEDFELFLKMKSLGIDQSDFDLFTNYAKMAGNTPITVEGFKEFKIRYDAFQEFKLMQQNKQKEASGPKKAAPQKQVEKVVAQKQVENYVPQKQVEKVVAQKQVEKVVARKPVEPLSEKEKLRKLMQDNIDSLEKSLGDPNAEDHATKESLIKFLRLKMIALQ
uniref:Uncharacterized protein n=1 Tax=viral metagenome TaxID=1070528 RepID=A0A6C0CA94_9ZZZZ